MGQLRSSDWRAFGGAGLLLVGRVGLLVVFANVLAYLFLGTAAPTIRGGVMAIISASLLIAASEIFDDRSLAPQSALQALAIAGVLVGVAQLVTMAFRDWQAFGTTQTISALLCLATGMAAAYALKRLQKSQRLRRKPPNNELERARDG